MHPDTPPEFRMPKAQAFASSEKARGSLPLEGGDLPGDFLRYSKESEKTCHGMAIKENWAAQRTGKLKAWNASKNWNGYKKNWTRPGTGLAGQIWHFPGFLWVLLRKGNDKLEM